MEQNNDLFNLASLVLPTGVLDFFTINNFVSQGSTHNIFLNEKNTPPEEYKKDKLSSKGFYEEVKIQDFPIRGKAVFLYIKRRRWLNETTGNIVARDWDLVAKGTRMTQEFASFLKAISRHQTSKL
jgi:hypothetical protein